MTDERLPVQIIIWVSIVKNGRTKERALRSGDRMRARHLQAGQWRFGIGRWRQSLRAGGPFIFRFTGCDARL
jgi:hypothetical protein